MVLWLILWIASWTAFFAGVMWLTLTTRRLHPDAALLTRVVLTLLLMAGVIFMSLTANASNV